MFNKKRIIIFTVLIIAVLAGIASAITFIGTKPLGNLKNDDVSYVYSINWGEAQKLSAEDKEKFVNAVSQIKVHAKGNPFEELWGSQPVGFIIVKKDGSSLTCGYDGIYFYKNGIRYVCKASEFTSVFSELQEVQE